MIIEWPKGYKLEIWLNTRCRRKKCCFSVERPWLLGREYSSVCLCFAGVFIR